MSAIDTLNEFRFRQRASAIVVLIVAIQSAGGCTNIHESPDFERHRYSQIAEPFDSKKDVLYFDVTFSAQFPDDDPAAEQLRMEWLEGWLAQRKFCPQGYEIVTRREFGDLEYNPARHDIRYEFKCASEPTG
jgi:hypothetical protein